MIWFYILAAIVGFFVWAYVHMLRCRAELFRRIADLKPVDVGLYAELMNRHLRESAVKPVTAQSSVEEVGSLGAFLDQTVKATYSYQRFDKVDIQSAVFAVGAHIGQTICQIYGGEWVEGGEHGPGLMVGTPDRNVLFYPFEKCASHREFGHPGDLEVYFSSAVVMARQITGAKSAEPHPQTPPVS